MLPSVRMSRISRLDVSHLYTFDDSVAATSEEIPQGVVPETATVRAAALRPACAVAGDGLGRSWRVDCSYSSSSSSFASSSSLLIPRLLLILVL